LDKRRITAEANHATIIAINHCHHNSGSLVISKMTVVILEGPATSGTARGKTRGSPLSESSPKMPVVGGKIIRKAIKNRMIPPASDKEGSDSCSKSKIKRPMNRKNKRMTSAMIISRTMILRRLSGATLDNTLMKKGTFPKGSITRNSKNAADTMDIMGAPSKDVVDQVDYLFFKELRTNWIFLVYQLV